MCLSSPAFPLPRFSGLRYCSTSCSLLHVCNRHVDGCNNDFVVRLQLECAMSFAAISKPHPKLIISPNITSNNLNLTTPTIPPLHPPPPRTPSKNLAPHPPTPSPGPSNLHLHHLDLSPLIPRLHLPGSNPRNPPHKPRIAGPRPLSLHPLLRPLWFHLHLNLHHFPQPQPTYLFPTFRGKQNLLLPPKKRHPILRSPGPPLITLPNTPPTTTTPKPPRSHKILRKRLSPRLALPHRLQLCKTPLRPKIPLYFPFPFPFFHSFQSRRRKNHRPPPPHLLGAHPANLHLGARNSVRGASRRCAARFLFPARKDGKGRKGGEGRKREKGG